MIAPSIGSAAWDAELIEAGVSREAVEALIARAFGGRDPRSMTAAELAAVYVDPCEVLETEQSESGEAKLTTALRAAGAEGELSTAAELVLTVAAELLLEERFPRGEDRWHLVGYGLYRVPAEEKQAWRWYARQLAALVMAAEASPSVKEDLLYSSTLERQSIADVLFPELCAALPEVLHPWLMSALPAVSWKAKRAHSEVLMERVFSSRPAPEIESAEWEEELSLVGVSEAEVRAYYDDVFGGAESGVYHLDIFHSFDEVRYREGGNLCQLLTRAERFDSFRVEEEALPRHALQTAVIFYAFWRHPSRTDLDYLRVCGWALHDKPKPHLPQLRRWMSRQIAACLASGWSEEDGAPSWVEVVVDQFFGFTDLDPVLFPWLVVDMPAELHPALLAGSSTVAWQAKRDFYARFAETPATHRALGEALAKSCKSGVFHSIDAREGLALLEKMEAAEEIDAAKRGELRALLTEPVVATVMAAAEPAASQFRDEHPGECFLALAFAADWMMWLMDADLWLGEECFGALATWYHGMWPEGPTTGRQGLQRDGASKPVPVERRQDAADVAESSEADAARERKIAWHAIALPHERAASLVGRRVEFRPRLG